MKYIDIVISSIIGLMINLLSVYLLTLGKINFSSLIFILVGSIVIIVIIGFQSKINEIREEIDEQKEGQKRVNEKLKIYEQLVDMKAEIKELQKRCKI